MPTRPEGSQPLSPPLSCHPLADSHAGYLATVPCEAPWTEDTEHDFDSSLGGLPSPLDRASSWPDVDAVHAGSLDEAEVAFGSDGIDEELDNYFARNDPSGGLPRHSQQGEDGFLNAHVQSSGEQGNGNGAFCA